MDKFIRNIFLVKRIKMVSIGDFLDAFGFENLLLMASFLVSFALINFSLNRFVKDKYGTPNKSLSGVIAFALSILVVYAVHTTGFDLSGFFFNMGIDSEIFSSIVYLVVFGAIIYILWKVGKKILLILGLLLILLSFTDWVYEKEIVLFTGIGLIILWAIIKFATRKKSEDAYSNLPPESPSININLNQQPSAASSRIDAQQRELEEKYARQREILQRQREIARQQRERAQIAEAESAKIEAKRRGITDLKQKYIAYLYEYSRFVGKDKGESGKRKRERIKQIMNTIISMAEKQGCPKARFLSNEIARTNAKAPEELRD